MPQLFKDRGYFTTGAGKVYHDGMDDPPSWLYPSVQAPWIQCGAGDAADAPADVPALPVALDYNGGANYCGITNESVVNATDESAALGYAMQRLDLAQASGRPWWVSIGIGHRPHISFRVPPGFWGPELYPRGAGDVVLPPKHPAAVAGSPYMAGNFNGDDFNDAGIGCPNCTVSSRRAVEYRRWYYAAVTWLDHNVGLVLRQLDSYGPDVVARTIVVFHADHGYQLGEGNQWSKKANTELATHVPLIVRAPFKAASVGKRTAVHAELVDLYRTLAELAGLGGVEDGVQGTSLAPVFDDPGRLSAELLAKPAFSQIARCACQPYHCKHFEATGRGCTLVAGAASAPACLNGSDWRCGWSGTECAADACSNTPEAQFNFMGYTMRTRGAAGGAAWRFTAWVPWDAATGRANWDAPVEYELFDLEGDDGRDFDFDGFNANLANDAAHAATVVQLRATLQAAVESWY